MEYILWFCIATIFLYHNIKIICSDISRKVIPNSHLKYMVVLLPIYYIYIYHYKYIVSIDLYLFIIQTLLALLISFLLYYFNIWWAGDAKYLLVLSLFIPHIWIIPFITNIALTTLSILLLHFVYLCVYKRLSLKQKYITIKNNLNPKQFLKNNSRSILIFILIFTVFKVSMLLLLMYAPSLEYNIPPIYLVWIPLVLISICILIIKYLLSISKDILIEKGYNVEKLYNTLLYISLTLLWLLVWYLLYIGTQQTVYTLKLTFTLYLLIAIVIISVKSLGNVWLNTQEKYLVSLNHLKEWDLLDLPYLKTVLKKKKHIIEEFWFDIDTANLDYESITRLKKMIRAINTIIKKDKKSSEDTIENIMISKTISYWGYIFWWFIVTLIVTDKINYYIFLILTNTSIV